MVVGSVASDGSIVHPWMMTECGLSLEWYWQGKKKVLPVNSTCYPASQRWKEGAGR